MLRNLPIYLSSYIYIYIYIYMRIFPWTKKKIRIHFPETSSRGFELWKRKKQKKNMMAWERSMGMEKKIRKETIRINFPEMLCSYSITNRFEYFFQTPDKKSGLILVMAYEHNMARKLILIFFCPADLFQADLDFFASITTNHDLKNYMRYFRSTKGQWEIETCFVKENIFFCIF